MSSIILFIRVCNWCFIKTIVHINLIHFIYYFVVKKPQSISKCQYGVYIYVIYLYFFMIVVRVEQFVTMSRLIKAELIYYLIELKCIG